MVFLLRKRQLHIRMTNINIKSITASPPTTDTTLIITIGYDCSSPAEYIDKREGGMDREGGEVRERER